MNVSKGTFTEHYDATGTPIYVVDMVVEGCNGFKAEVVFDEESGIYIAESEVNDDNRTLTD